MIEQIKFPGLLTEMQDYCDRKDLEMKGLKALRVITKCILRGHYQLAERIGLKYRRILPQNDLAVAYEYSLIAANFLKTKP